MIQKNYNQQHLGSNLQINHKNIYIRLKLPEKTNDNNEIAQFKQQNLHKKLQKYFANRYNFFHKFDCGIILDEESWYSVTPEKIAKRISERYRNHKYIADVCCGCGGNSIHFANYAKKVISVDIDTKKLCYLINNAKIYQVEHKIFPLRWDATTFQGLKVDLAFSSPPWGGINYQNEFYNILKYIYKRYVN